MTDTDRGHSGFWSTLPGILTGIAAVIAAGTGVIVAMRTHPTPDPGDVRPRESVVTPSIPPREPGASTVVPAPTPAPSTFSGAMGPLEPGISYNQGDLYDQPASSAEECSTICYNDNRCVAVTFVISQKRCWVKNAAKTIGQSPDMVSARRLVQ